MRNLVVILLIGLVLIGCTQNPPSNPSAGSAANTSGTIGPNESGNPNDYIPGDYGNDDNYTYVPELYFYEYGTLPDATLGVPYRYSFCSPEPAGANDLCGSLNDNSNPSNGHYPYHFTLDSGRGFPPMGLTLGLNGLLTGTPSAIGNNTFGVCAVDLDGKQACVNVTLVVKKPIELTVHLTGSGHGKVTVISDNTTVVCTQDCVVPFATSYASASLYFMPDDGSAFGGWSGECSGTSRCYAFMNGGDKTVTAEFDKFDMQVTSATCTYVPSGGYDFLIKVSATANGPKNSYLSMDFAHYNGFMDMTNDCGSWTSVGNGASYRNDGEAGTTRYTTSFRMGSPIDSRTRPFDWNPSLMLAVGYGSDYGSSDDAPVKNPPGTQIVVPMKIHCD